MKKNGCMLFFLLLTLGCSRPKLTPVAEKPTPVTEQAKAVVETYSNMHFDSGGQGDLLGWEFQVTHLATKYDVIMICGEGEPQGPVYVSGELENNRLVLVPENDICGTPIRIRFAPKGAYITAGDNSSTDYVPHGELHRGFPKVD